MVLRFTLEIGGEASMISSCLSILRSGMFSGYMALWSTSCVNKVSSFLTFTQSQSVYPLGSPPGTFFICPGQSGVQSLIQDNKVTLWWLITRFHFAQMSCEGRWLPMFPVKLQGWITNDMCDTDSPFPFLLFQNVFRLPWEVGTGRWTAVPIT